nr:sulfatase-like hydrolase/transferase [Prolixibacter bellariivorans]
MKTKNLLLGLALTSPIAAKAVKSAPVEKKPNVVIFFIDDMGYSDISCYGQKKWKTPNIDQLAENGIRFTDAYSASPICSPSRAGLLTGRYPARMGIQQVFFPDNYTGIPQKELLIPELLKTAGYTTGIIGKWHLGSREKFLPLQNGFDEYFGIPYSNDMSSQVYLRGNDVVQFHIDQSHMTKKYTEEAISFIDRHKDQPFFLELAHNMMHVPIFCSPEFRGKSGAGLYGDAVLEVDWSIGQVMAELKKQGLLDNTLVIFSSDNGPWLQEGPLGGEAKPCGKERPPATKGASGFRSSLTGKGKSSRAPTMKWFGTSTGFQPWPISAVLLFLTASGSMVTTSRAYCYVERRAQAMCTLTSAIIKT